MSEEPPAMPSAQFPQPHVEAKTSIAAVWSLVFGISSFCLWLLGSVPAMILGTIALMKINQSQGRLEGRGLAVAGLVTGGVGVIAGIFSIALLAGMMMPAFSGVLHKAKITKQMADVKVISISCRVYAADHNGNFPADLKELYPEYLEDESMLKTFGERGEKDLDYIYFPGYRDDGKATSKPLVASPSPIAGSRVMGLVGGEVVEVREKEFQRLMESVENER